MEDMDSVAKGDRKEGVRAPAASTTLGMPKNNDPSRTPGGTKKKQKVLKSKININDRFGYRYR